MILFEGLVSGGPLRHDRSLYGTLQLNLLASPVYQLVISFGEADGALRRGFAVEAQWRAWWQRLS